MSFEKPHFSSEPSSNERGEREHPYLSADEVLDLLGEDYDPHAPEAEKLARIKEVGGESLIEEIPAKNKRREEVREDESGYQSLDALADITSPEDEPKKDA